MRFEGTILGAVDLDKTLREVCPAVREDRNYRVGDDTVWGVK